MLPLVQRHHQMVQPSPHLDPLATLQGGHVPIEYLTLQRQPAAPHGSINAFEHTSDLRPAHRSFPIRSAPSSQPLYHRAAASFNYAYHPDHSDHRLRRKTPNGTIDAGYDGSPYQLATGPPPLKHMMLLTSQNVFPSPLASRAPAQTDFQAPGLGTRWSPSLVSAAGNDNLRFAGTGQMGDIHGALQLCPGSLIPGRVVLDGSPDIQTTPSYHFGNEAALRPPLLQTQLNLPRHPPVFSPTVLYPSPFWKDADLVTFRPGSYAAGLSNRQQELTPFSVGLATPWSSTDILLPDLALGSRDGVNPSFFGGTSSQHHTDMLASQLPDHRLEALTLDSSKAFSNSPQSTAGIPSPTGFKEKVLLHAHKTYVDLLSHLHQSKKGQYNKSPGTVRSPAKIVVFPKPPKQLGIVDVPRPAKLSRFYTDTANQVPHDARSMSVVASMAAKSVHPIQPISTIPSHVVGRRLPQHSGIAGSAFAGVQRQPTHPLYPYSTPGIGSPLAQAKSSLELLSDLCEQSGWKWVDGMLLGGCLYYGLERYEEALDWFSRIVALDNEHVEAISNIAATLYCLNRQADAEKQWLRAVHLRPGYLEAVEHLVGLLSSEHRNKEAVDVINYVQQSLRQFISTTDSKDTSDSGQLMQSAPTRPIRVTEHENTQAGFIQHRGRQSDPLGMPGEAQTGFGSSGYAIPGNENGRMLALIHAKGNMLYSLKDVEDAASAFEEAVLISAGWNITCIEALIHKIRVVLSPRSSTAEVHADSTVKSTPLLLPPEGARHTARLVFSESNGELPGLHHVPEGNPRRSAISTTSNSLLSLAKIFQDSMSSGTAWNAVSRQPSGVSDILALYYLSLSLQESPSTANNVGILLASVPHQGLSQSSTPSERSSGHNLPGIVPGSGLALALAYYNYGLTLDRKHVHLHTNLGSLLKDIGQLDLAIQMYEQAVACDGTFDIALTNLANAVKDRGRISDAIVYYKRAVTSNPDFAEAVCGLSTALNSVCDWRGRGGVILLAGKYDRWHVDENGVLEDAKSRPDGTGLMKRVVGIVRRQLGDSSRWGSGMLQRDTIATLSSQIATSIVDNADRTLDIQEELRIWAGKPWEGSKLVRFLERATRVTMRRWYLDKYVKGAESARGYLRPRPPIALTVPSAPTVLPFHTFTYPLTAKDIRMISQRNAIRISCSALRSPWLPDSVYPPPAPPNPHLNVGYVSSDFNNHPLAHLMQSVFGLHDKSRVKAFCYATTASDRSVHRLQIEREAPVFQDVSNWPSDRFIDRIVQDGIHILVNLNGYTRGARNEIFAARPAPIQMSFMGFAGTLGAEWCDYILADSISVPPETLRPSRRNVSLADVFYDEAADHANSDWVYSENVIFCRDTFFCCDHAQSGETTGKQVTWADEERRRWRMRKELFPMLSDDTIILGNFNQLYKIDPTTFRTWLRILSGVPKAVLWLLRFPELGESNLTRTARDWGGEEVAKRIIFTDVAPKQEHISRARICDLFLDTPECNAHTTAADVLWSSTPLLTLPRYPYKMCSRMAASILRGALPKDADGNEIARELIATDEDEYEETAVRLANGLIYRVNAEGYGQGSGRLAEMRKTLFRHKWACALFDTRRWVADLERGYIEAWRRWVAGESGDIFL